jgi:hypothetical protein
MTSTTVGSFNERGYLNGFKRRGFTPPKCLLELVANSLDACDRRRATGWGGKFYIRFATTEPMGIIDKGQITMRDNGYGMDADAIRNMFDLYRENHASDTSRGVSGIGAKPALSILSCDQEMMLFTRTEGGTGYHIVVPWNKIHEDGHYSGMIRIRTMTAEEQAVFGDDPGTLIQFPYSDMLRDLLRSNFQLPAMGGDDIADMSPLDRIGVVFGTDNVDIVLEDTDRPPVLMQMYNYFGAADGEYYLGKTKVVVAHWVPENPSEQEDIANHRFICCSDGREIHLSGRGFAKKLEIKNKGTHGYRHVGSFEVICGLRKDKSIFDPSHPQLLSGSTKEHRCAYNDMHLGRSVFEFLILHKLRRNGQLVGYVPLSDYKITSARANEEAMLENLLVQSEIRYCPVSTQGNIQDRLLNIQENKNQHDGSHLPLHLTRLVRELRTEKAKQIRVWMEATVAEKEAKTAAKVPAPVSAPSPVPAPVSTPAAPSPAPAPAPVSTPAAPSPAPAPAPVSTPAAPAAPSPVTAPTSAPVSAPASPPASTPQLIITEAVSAGSNSPELPSLSTDLLPRMQTLSDDNLIALITDTVKSRPPGCKAAIIAALSALSS